MYRFGVFHFDADGLELSRDGRPVRLQPQPAQVLLALLANAGRTVSREELRQAVWHDDTYVDFDRGLNFCIAQIRGALGDDAVTPRYIRTIPKRGYEFVCPVDAGDKPVRRFRSLAAAVAAAVVIAAAALFAYRLWTVSRAVPIVAI